MFEHFCFGFVKYVVSWSEFIDAVLVQLSLKQYKGKTAKFNAPLTDQQFSAPKISSAGRVFLMLLKIEQTAEIVGPWT